MSVNVLYMTYLHVVFIIYVFTSYKIDKHFQTQKKKTNANLLLIIN